MTQVPGDFKKVDLSDLLRRKEFHRLRGKTAGLTPFLREILFNEESPLYGRTPSQVKARWKKTLSLANPLVMLLAQLRRQGDEALANHVLNALERKDYLLPGEQQCGKHGVIPITAFMLVPEKTLVLLDWFYKVADLMFFLPGWRNEFRPQCEKLLEAYPSLGGYVRDETWTHGVVSGEYLGEGHPLRIVQAREVVMPLRGSLQRVWEKLPDSFEVYDERIIALKIRCQRFSWSSKEWPERSPEPHCMTGHGLPRFNSVYERVCGEELPPFCGFFSRSFLFLALDAEQGDILDCFSREEQERVATWQFKIPRSQVNLCTPGLTIGLHEAGQHAGWQNAWPLFASRGISRNIGGLLISHYGSEGENLYEELESEYESRCHDWKHHEGAFHSVFST